jgi:rhodanese-related sulfurtransferase
VQELDQRMAEVPKDKPVVVYCQSGGRASMAAQAMQAQGYEVYNLGAMSSW